MIGLLLGLAVAAAQPSTLVTIAPTHRLIEGVTTDGKNVWVSSVLDRQLLRCITSCTRLATLPKSLHPMAIAWDAKRKQLWVAADCPELPGVDKCERGALVALDRRGNVRTRIAPSLGAFHPGDVSASSAGDVFVSDSQNGAVFRLTPSGSALIAIVVPGVGKSAQGSALDAAGKRLIVADYSQGIAAIDLETGTRTLLTREDGRPVRGIDGMLRCGARYYAIYNGASPGMLIRFTVDGERIPFEPVIEGAPLADPTQLTTDGKRLLIVADAGWEGALKGTDRTDPAPILALDLPAPCEN